MDEKTLALVDALAKKLGIVGSNVIEAYTRQAYVNVVDDLFCLSAWATVAYLGIKLTNFCIIPDADAYGSQIAELALQRKTISLLILIVFSVFAFMLVGDAVEGVLNPDYFAIHSLIKELK
jgi:uncharacterized protein (DUF486 family)